MIRLRSDCLVFETESGESIPCSAELVTVELIGDAMENLDPELVRNAAAAVLHYFKVELHQEAVSISEFSRILAGVLRGFGIDVKCPEEEAEDENPATPEPVRDGIVEADLSLLVDSPSFNLELLFFGRLRDLLQQQLVDPPKLLRFSGLRGCVKTITGAKRWSRRCQRLNDQIVDYLRECLNHDAGSRRCKMVVS